MARPSPRALLLGIALAPLLALAFWCRVTSLNVPAGNGDEHFYGVQAARLLSGEAIDSDTASGNPINAFVLALEVPLYAALGPSPLVVKIPPVAAGVLAVVGAFALWGRALDRATGLIGGTLMAVLPIAIIECRVGAEPAWNPLVGVLALAAAFRGHRLATLSALLACYYVHPTYLFSLPIYGLVLLAKLLERTRGDRRERLRVLASTAALFGGVLGPLVWLTSGRSAIQWTYQVYEFGPSDWPRYFLLFERLLMGFCECGIWETSPAFDRAFWAVVSPIVAGGSAAMIRRRQWDRLALVVGLAATLVGMHLVTGPDILRPYFARYGLYLVAPSALAISCCARALLAPAIPGWRGRLRPVQVAVLLCLAWVLVLGAKRNFFDHVFGYTNGPERFWTLRTEAVDPYRWLSAIILDDLEHDPRGGDRVVLAEDWWTYRPLQFFAGGHPRIAAGTLEHFDESTREHLMRKHLALGGYVVGTDGREVIEQVRTLCAPEELRHWHVECKPYPTLAIYRLRRHDERREDRPIVVLRPGDRVAAPLRR